MNNILQGDQLTIGTCYYPEHWPKTLWEEDLKRMLDVGIEVIRIAEFAWSLVEPEEGVFTYDFFDEFLEVAARVGMKVIFCTPTATPPAWLTFKYPEVLNTNMDGIPYEHGARRHYNYNAPVYRELSAVITEKFASHYACHPNIIGWQIDNELNCEMDRFYSKSDAEAFRTYLKEKYENLENLNHAWGTTFWNQGYTDWTQVDVPRKTVSNSVNPHRELDYIRFISRSATDYAALQSVILRKHLKEGDFITTNGMFSNLDNHKMTRDSLDFFTYDSYPNFAYSLNSYKEGDLGLKDRWWSKNLSETRSISSEFGIMEQQSGANGWNTSMEAPAPRPGQLTLWTMQSVAHGADFISYFRWRTCTMGTEIYWHGILDYSGRDNRRLKEVAEVHKKFEAIKSVAGAKYEAKVAVLKDYDNVWDSKVDVWHKSVTDFSENAIYTTAQRTHTPLDFLYLTEDMTIDKLTKYDVIFYPHPSIVTDERVTLLESYVANGGKLIIGCRSGYKDITGQCTMDLLPGKLSSLTGCDIPEYSFIAPDSDQVMVRWEEVDIEASVFLDLVVAQGAMASLEGAMLSGDYIGQGALVKNTFGKGECYYFGSAFSEQAAEVFFEKMGVINPYSMKLTLTPSCEVSARVKEDERYYFLLNYERTSIKINVISEMTDLYTGEQIQGEIVMPPYGTLVLKE